MFLKRSLTQWVSEWVSDKVTYWAVGWTVKSAHLILTSLALPFQQRHLSLMLRLLSWSCAAACEWLAWFDVGFNFLLLPGCCFCMWLRNAARFVHIFRHILQIKTLLLLWWAVLACNLCSSSPLNSAPQLTTPHRQTFSWSSLDWQNTPWRSFSCRDALCFDWNFSPQTLQGKRSPVCVRWCCWNPTCERNCLLQTCKNK